ncbi:unnamed protein product [Calypogeia fissa]
MARHCSLQGNASDHYALLFHFNGVHFIELNNNNNIVIVGRIVPQAIVPHERDPFLRSVARDRSSDSELEEEAASKKPKRQERKGKKQARQPLRSSKGKEPKNVTKPTPTMEEENNDKDEVEALGGSRKEEEQSSSGEEEEEEPQRAELRTKCR